MECMIFLADDCNLSCAYCYEGNHKRKERISDTTIEKALDFIVRVNRDEEINLTFLGGEPMLNKKMMYYTVDFIQNKYDIPFHYFITTNGTCCNYEDIDFMHRYKFEISLSIDGTKETHEMNRSPQNKEDKGLYYQKIMNNFAYMIEKDIPFTVRMTVTCNNVTGLYHNILYFFDMGVKKFDIAFNEFEEWGFNDLKELEKQFFEIDSWFMEHINEITFLNIFDGKSTFFIAKRKLQYCSAGSKKHFVINSNGEFYPCSYVCNDLSWSMGTVNTVFDEKKCFNKIKDNLAKINKCKECDINFACIGARCGFKNYCLTEKLNEPPKNLCNLEKILYKHNELVFLEMYRQKSERFMKFYNYAVENHIELTNWMLKVIKEVE